MKQVIFLFISITIFFITFSCTPQKRLTRFVKLHPELTIADTIKINDTVITTQLRIDTAFHHSTIKDTITIEKERLKLQIVEIRDTIYVEVQVNPDTIVIEREIPIERFKIQQSREDKIQDIDDLLNKRWFWVAVGGILILIVLSKLFTSK